MTRQRVVQKRVSGCSNGYQVDRITRSMTKLDWCASNGAIWQKKCVAQLGSDEGQWMNGYWKVLSSDKRLLVILTPLIDDSAYEL